jgi:hypothetical protein
LAFGRQLCCRPKAKTVKEIIFELCNKAEAWAMK